MSVNDIFFAKQTQSFPYTTIPSYFVILQGYRKRGIIFSNKKYLSSTEVV
jgi:hypothetical protein